MPGTTQNGAVFQPRIEAWRLHRNFTQRELAQRSGLALTTINEIETGKRTARPASLQKLADALDTESWNLYNHPRGDSYGVAPQILSAVDRLDDLATDFTIGSGGGQGLAWHVINNAGDDEDEIFNVWSNVQAVVEFLLPSWFTLTEYLRRPERSDDTRQTVEFSLANRMREWRRDGFGIEHPSINPAPEMVEAIEGAR